MAMNFEDVEERDGALPAFFFFGFMLIDIPSFVRR